MNVKNVSATITPEIVERIDELVRQGQYRNRSHAIEEGLKRLITAQTQ
jgi:Arc/MetJ-type ribon-helix-helix transcriptional regulator